MKTCGLLYVQCARRSSTPQTRFRVVILLLSIAATLSLPGCGGKVMVPVTGTVKSKGQPAIGAMVMFHSDSDPQAQTASGVVGDDGTFTLTSGLEQGLAPGSYTVTITWPDPSVKPTQQQIMMGMIEPGPDLLKGKYASRQSSQLKQEITEGMTEPVEFDVAGP